MSETAKQRIRQRFSRAAGTYDAHAEVQKDLAARLFRELPEEGIDCILEIGCGTGRFTALLAERYPEGRIIALDFAEGMVHLARKRLADKGNVSVLCEDGERFLAACPTTFALICANSTLQWFDDLGATLAQIGAVLRHANINTTAIYAKVDAALLNGVAAPWPCRSRSVHVGDSVADGGEGAC